MAVTRTRMSAIAQRLDPWLPPILLMVVIFGFSAQSNLNSGLGKIMPGVDVRKFVHAGEYALLCFLWWRALRTVVAGRAAIAVAFAIAVAYSATDEYHQHFVAGRHGMSSELPVSIVCEMHDGLIASLVDAEA